MLTPIKLVLNFWGCYLCATFGENRSKNATVRVRTDRQTHARTDRDKLNLCLSHAICYSYGADNYGQVTGFSLTAGVWPV